MKSLLFSMLVQIVKTLVGSLNYETVRRLVLDVDGQALSGAEKRVLVLTEARNVGLAIGTALLNLAIETAVTAMRNRE